MKNKNITLTISIPTYSRDELLKEQLYNIDKQVSKLKIAKYIEILVSDNCSIDRTHKICSEFESKNTNYKFTYIRRDKNTGTTLNFMNSLLDASGDYVWLMSDDDFIYNNSIEYLYNKLNSNSEVGFAFINYHVSKEKKLTAIPENLCDHVVETFDQFIGDSRCAFGFVSALCFKKEALSKSKMLHYFNTDRLAYTQMYWVADVAKKYNSLIINKPLLAMDHPGVLETRRRVLENKVDAPNKIDGYMEAHIDFLIFTGYVYSNKVSLKNRLSLYRSSNNSNLNQIIFHKITSKKYDKITIQFAFINMVRYFYFSPIFWLIHVPILLLPSSIAKNIMPYRWKYIALRSSAFSNFKNFFLKK